MESSLQAGRQMLRIKPRTVLFKRNLATKTAVDKIHYYHPTHHTTVIIKNFQAPKEIKPFVKQFYQLEMNATASFNRYFECDVHSQLIHLQ